jgi:hypothetical protein
LPGRPARRGLGSATIPHVGEAQAAPPPNPIGAPPNIQVFSTQRLLLEDGHENQRAAGNGQAGDETSEDTSITWDGTTAHPFGLAAPGQVPAALLR